MSVPTAPAPPPLDFFDIGSVAFTEEITEECPSVLLLADFVLLWLGCFVNAVVNAFVNAL